MTEYEFWDNRYRLGGDSGKGSTGIWRKWKWRIIEGFVRIEDKSVLDVGCGDLQFVKGKKFKSYMGIDISPFIIGKHQRMKSKHPERFEDWAFFVCDATTSPPMTQADVVLCMDLLFHIMDDTRFAQLLDNLNIWAGEWLFVIGWSKNPFPDGKICDNYQYFRDLKAWLDHLPNLAFVGEFKPNKEDVNSLYVFRRRYDTIIEDENPMRDTQ
jgi:SAM-dependent methyltransferase